MKNLLGQLPEIRRPVVSALLRQVILGIVAIGLGLAVASQIVAGHKYLVAVAILSIPALIILQRRPFVSILVWLVFTPFLLQAGSQASRQVYWVIHRFLPPLTLVAILLPSGLGIGKRTLPKLGFPEWAMLGYVIASFISIMLTNASRVATLYLFYDRVVIPMMLYLIVRLSNPGERMIRWLIPVAIFIALSQSGIGIISWFDPHALPAKFVDYQNHRTIGTMVNTNAYVSTLILVGFLILHYGLQGSSKRMRVISILIFLMTGYGIFISFSRAGWLAGILALAGLLAIYPKFVLRVGLVVVPLFILAAGIFLQGQLTWASQRLISDQSTRSAFSRVPVYAAALRMFQIKPVFGWGYGNFDLFDRQFQEPVVANIAGDNKDHASHNFFLTLIAEQGLLGTLLYLAPFFYWLGRTIRKFGDLPREGFWGRKILVVFWMAILSHIVVYNFANMRVVFALGCLWITQGLIGHFLDSRQPGFVRELAQAKSVTQTGLVLQKPETV